MNSQTPDEIKYLLINTPLTDPTLPYHSIPYLVGATTKAGFTGYFCLDLNIELLNYMAQEAQVAHLIDACNLIRSTLRQKTKLTRNEQMLYGSALKGCSLKPNSVLSAIQIMKNSDTFYNYTLYSQAVETISKWIDALSVKGLPGQFDNFYTNLHGVMNLSSLEDLTNELIIDRFIAPFEGYFKDEFCRLIMEQKWDFIGLSVNYTFQLPFAVWMCKYIRSLLPDTVLCLGGTEISDLVKYLKNPIDIWNIFPSCSALMIGEGESALIQILKSIQNQQPLPKHHPGILNKEVGLLRDDAKVIYEDLTNASEPRYDVWDWDQYWSPEPVVLYSPTRGCYWNKCTFCDYGLSTDAPTSPSREKSVEEVVKDITNITKFSRTLYFAVDAISPLYLRKLAEALVENNINIRWSAELRLERAFKKDLASHLKKAGCVCISFGYESGSQRILNLIDKGVNIQDVPQILKQLSEENIGVQMMGFIGFPSESVEEAFETFTFLKENRECWTLAGIGDFLLTPNAIVAKQFKDFGIKKLAESPGDDILRRLNWIEENGHTRVPGDMRTTSIKGIAKSLHLRPGDRPFVGGIDTGHTILYFAKFGKNLIPCDIRNGQYEQALELSNPCANLSDKLGALFNTTNLREYRYQLSYNGKAINFNSIRSWLDECP